MTFHRKGTPTYFGGLPGGYDYLNKPTDPSVGGTGSPAFADGKKVGGPNDGTYLVAFGEDATSLDANRPASALGDNTDFLDDLFHRDIAVPTRTTDAVSAGVSSLVISGQVFVGALGVSNTADQRGRLISVLDSNDLEVIDSSGVTVSASLIHNGSNVNVVGTQTSGFYLNPTVNFTPAIPAGVTYRVYYGVRSNLATLPVSALTDVAIRAAQEVDGVVQAQLRSLHAPSNLQAWDAPWDSTIRALAAAGLNERYRRSTLVPGSFNFNTPGDGATITRDGKALEVVGVTNTLGIAPTSDKNNALIRLTSSPATVVGGAWPNTARGGDVGIWFESDLNGSNTASEISRPGMAGPALMTVVPRNYTSGTLTTQAFTFISPTGTATLNPSSGPDSSSRRKIQCAAGQYFRIPSGPDVNKTAIRLGIDMLEVTIGGVTNTWVITDFIGTNQVLVSAITGQYADFGATAAAANIKLIQVVTSIGGVPDNVSTGRFPIGLFATPPSTQVGGDSLLNRLHPATFISPTGGTSEPPASSDTDIAALHWGYFDNTSGQIFYTGQLRGDGQIRTKRGSWMFSVGDGVNTFGDFNGASAIRDVVSYLESTVGAGNWSVTIYAKAGIYDFAAGPLTMSSGVQTLKIIGDGKEQTILQNNGSGPTISLSVGTMIFENLKLYSGSNGPIKLGNNTVSNVPRIIFKDCSVYGPIIVDQPTEVDFNVANSIYAVDSYFTTSGAGIFSGIINPGILNVVPNATGAIKLNAITFENCKFDVQQDCPLIKLSASIFMSVWIGAVSFVRCKIRLGGTSAALSQLLNSGVIHVLTPSDLALNSQVDSVLFKDCDVLASGTRPILAYTQFAPNFACLSFTIDGGKWLISSSASVIDINPFSLVPGFNSHLTAQFVGYNSTPLGATTGGESILKFSLKNAIIGYGPQNLPSSSSPNWMGPTAFTAHYGTMPSFQDQAAVGVTPTYWGAWTIRAATIDVENVGFYGGVNRGNLPEFELFALNRLSFKKVELIGNNVTGSGSAPPARLSLVAGSLAGTAEISQVFYDGFASGAVTVGGSIATISHALVSATSGPAPGHFRFIFDHCSFGNVAAGSAKCIGYGVGGKQGFVSLTVRDCEFYSCDSAMTFGEPLPLLLNVLNNKINDHSGFGINLSPTTWTIDRSILIQGNTVINNGSIGINCQAGTWELTGTNGNASAIVAGPRILNNEVYNNNFGNNQISIGTTSADHPGGVVMGNNCHGESIGIFSIATTGYIYTIGLQPMKSGSGVNLYPWVNVAGSRPNEFESMGLNHAVIRYS